jgi:GNAT superfamily N-acetyltransferase
MNTLPQGFTVRPPTMDDVKTVFDIIIASDTAIHGAPEPGYTLDDLRHDWQAPGHNLATDNWIVLSPTGRAVGASGVWHRNDCLRFYTHPSIHPEYSGLGIGSFLLQKAEACARQYIPLANPIVVASVMSD